MYPRADMDDRMARAREAWRALAGLRDLDHPAFGDVARAWRVVCQPTFHDDVAITVADLGDGGLLELRVVPSGLRVCAMRDAGFRMGTSAPTSSPRVWLVELTPAALVAFATSLPVLPPSPVEPGRDGMTVEHEVLVEGAARCVMSWNPTRADAPQHHAFVQHLCALAEQTVADPAAHAALRPLAEYLR